jgi:K+-sensing histidine kinase KdpD
MAPDTRHEGSLALALGPVLVAFTAGVLAEVRDELGVTNIALILAAIVSVTALAGRLAGVVTGFTAAVAFNFFQTVPYHSLRIDGVRDVVTVCLLAALGLVMGEFGAWRRRAQAVSNRSVRDARTLETTSAMLAAGCSAADLWQAIHDNLVALFGLVDCRFEPGSATTVPVLARTGSLVAPSMQITREGFALPAGGVALAVVASGSTRGHIVLVPGEPTGSTLESRRMAVALADQLAVALARESVTR